MVAIRGAPWQALLDRDRAAIRRPLSLAVNTPAFWIPSQLRLTARARRTACDMGDKQTDWQISVHFREPWFAAPLRLMEVDTGLSPDTRLTLIYMLGLGCRPGWTIYVSHVQRVLGLGPRRWKRIRKELEAHGYLWSERGHANRGIWKWTYHLSANPTGRETADQHTIHATCMDGKRIDGNRIDAGCEDKHTLTSTSSTKRKSKEAAEGAGAATANAARKPAAEPGPGRLGFPGVVHRCRVWNTDDVARVEAVVERSGVAAVEAWAGDRMPLPSELEAEFAKRARDEAAVRTRAAASTPRGPTTEMRAQRRADATAELEALMDDADNTDDTE